MTQKDKELLMKDLCARLTYGVKVTFFNEDLTYHSEPKTLIGIECINNLNYSRLEDEDGNTTIVEFVKPYLFPLSSMTEGQLKDVKASLHQELIDIYENGSEEHKVPEYPQTWYYVQDWYNAHHFDYRGLIEKGLAIDATELNIY